VTTATLSPYFLPKRAIAPDCERGVDRELLGRDRVFSRIAAVDQRLDVGERAVGQPVEMAEVEAQPIGSDERARLLDVKADDLAQRAWRR
jgi:hypothetical protein